MKTLLNMMNLCYYNIKHTNDIYCKEKYLNRFLILIKCSCQLMKFISEQYINNPELIIEYLLNTDQEYLILLTGDLTVIQKYINIPENMQLTYDKSFHIIECPVDCQTEYHLDSLLENSESWDNSQCSSNDIE